MSNESNPIERNFAYYKLVNDENDFVGMIAYTIYKKAKIEYLKQLKQDLNSQEEIDRTLEIWQKSQCSPSQIKIYRNNGTQLLTDFTNELINSKVSNFEKQRLNLIEREKKLKKSNRDSFLKNVVSGIVSSFLFTFISICIYLFLDKGFDLTTKIIGYFK